MVEIISSKQIEFMKSNDSAYREAVDLACHMVKKFYPENEVFHPLDSTAGVISQIDNMVTGLKRAKSQ